jgi:hypothetical protein
VQLNRLPNLHPSVRIPAGIAPFEAPEMEIFPPWGWREKLPRGDFGDRGLQWARLVFSAFIFYIEQYEFHGHVEILGFYECLILGKLMFRKKESEVLEVSWCNWEVYDCQNSDMHMLYLMEFAHGCLLPHSLGWNLLSNCWYGFCLGFQSFYLGEIILGCLMERCKTS